MKFGMKENESRKYLTGDAKMPVDIQSTRKFPVAQNTAACCFGELHLLLEIPLLKTAAYISMHVFLRGNGVWRERQQSENIEHRNH